MRHLSVCLALVLTHASLASGQNILNNPGFEYGLMCYLTNIWAGDDIFGHGEYRLHLSPDAHSGDYSLEIGCPGGDCFKAAAYSNKIPTVPSQDYTLSLYAKCPAGATATVHIPNTTQGDISKFMNCNGTWTANTVSFRMASNAEDFFFYLFSYYGQWARFDDVVLTYGDGSAPAPTILHGGNRNVSVASQALLVDGAPYLALGFFDVSYSELAQAKAIGVNTLFGLGYNPSAACFNTTQMGYQDRAYELGLNFVPDSTTTAKLAVPAVFPAVMQKFAPHLANIAWMLADEPDQSFIPFWYMDPAVFNAEYHAAKTKTTLPIFADFQRAAWSVTSDVAPYASAVDFFMGEPYGHEFQYLNHATNMFKSLPPARPIWLAQDNPDANLIVPKAYWAITNGATGIAYFTWDIFKAEPPKFAAAQQVFSELGQLKSVIFSQNINPFVKGTPGISYAARYQGGSAYILAANSNLSPDAAATFQMSGLAAGQQVQVMFENRTITASAGSFTDNFAGVARHVYVVNVPIAAIAGSIVTKSGPDNARVWRIQATNTGLAALTGATITSVTFTQTGGPACTPLVLSAFPVAVGDIAPGASAPGDLNFDFSGCASTTKFTVKIGLAASGVTNSIVRNNERK